ncbi:MAG: nodulation protein NfeD [Ardenticatenia bacterium]|nr:MAG: nodulation protein NfeD [Ardenticatenia bacterium]
MPMNQKGRTLWSLTVLLLLVWANIVHPLAALAQSERPQVLVLTFEGPVTPVLVSYLERAEKEALQRDAELIVLRLDTPGGSVEVMGDVVRHLDNAQVPVAVFVWPSGARAASAGTFVVLAAHVAAMAPKTTMGAASPVDASGAEMDETLARKITNDLVASIRAHAERRGPDAVEWAELAVREAVVATADEALELGLIDAIARDVPDLLEQVDGLSVEVQGEPHTLHLRDAVIVELPMTPLEQFLHTIADPNIALLLLSLAGVAILIELQSPGGYVAGIFGVIALVLGFYALGVLDANFAGLGLLLLAFFLFFLEVLSPSVGVFALGGGIAFVLAGLLLFNGREYATVSLPFLLTMAVLLVLFSIFVLTTVVRLRKKPPVTGQEGMIGLVGVVREPLTPEGIVHVHGEVWRARSLNGTLDVGRRVRVVGLEGMTLLVEPVEDETPTVAST